MFGLRALILYFACFPQHAAARAVASAEALPIFKKFKVPAPDAQGLFCILESSSFKYSEHTAQDYVRAASRIATRTRV